MKKIILLSLTFFGFFISSLNLVSANWYGNHGVNYTYGVTSCTSDGDTTGGSDPTYGEFAVAKNNSSTTLTPENSVYNISTSGTMRCLYWDGAKPTVTDNYTYDGVWKNLTSVTITLSPSDTGGSGIKETRWCEGPSCNPSSGISGTSITKNSNYNNTIRYQTWDIAGNASVIGSIDVKLDTTKPTLLDVTNTNPLNLLANSNYNYSISISENGGSPIAKVEGSKENKDDEFLTNFTDNHSPWTQNWDISIVDNYRESDGGRKYIFRLTKICDQAGNCWNGNKDYYHNVYANTANIITKNIISNQLTDDANIADGTTKNLSITLKDNYGNEIVPASGISRIIDFNWNITNTMFLNQYTRTGSKSVYVNKTTDSGNFTNNRLLGGNTSFNGETSTNGTYTYGFKFYTPTSNQGYGPVSDPDAKFVINNLTFDINSTLTNSTGANPQNQSLNSWSSITAKFNPLYYSQITEEINDNGFVEGARQDSKISIKKNGIKSTTNNNLQLSYGGTDASKFNLYAGTNTNNAMSGGILITLTKENITSPLSFPSDPSNPSNNNLFTYLLQRPGQVGNVSKIYLASHITYTIDGKNVVYNSDIVGKDLYHGTEENIGNQSALKVLGQVSSKSRNAITNYQYKSDVNIVGNSDKFLSKTQMRKNGWEFAKNVVGYTATVNPLTNINNPDIGTHVNNVIYFGSSSGAGDNVYQLGNGSDIGINTNKTILVIGGNLYIKNNLYYTGNGMLGIVVLKDENGKGGNIYVDPSVTNLVGIMFAEKSILGYDGTNEIDGSVAVQTIKNQLHIYGSLFSENTIGGSRKATPRCPYFITTGCTIEVAQKYDLNYLRRYYLIDSIEGGISYKKPANDGKVIGGGTYDSSGNITGGNLKFARNITNTSDSYASNSVLIEYNSKIQSIPPPLFTTSN